jgi:hypothetical protein
MQDVSMHLVGTRSASHKASSFLGDGNTLKETLNKGLSQASQLAKGGVALASVYP